MSKQHHSIEHNYQYIFSEKATCFWLNIQSWDYIQT